MANALGIDLMGKVVVVKGDMCALDRLFECSGGFGCSPDTTGRKVFGTLLCRGTEGFVYGDDVERLATPEEVQSCKRRTP